MRTLREVMRLKFVMKMTGRAIGRSCGLSPATVSGYLGRIEVAKLGWPLPPELDDDDALNRLLFPHEGHPVARRAEPEWCVIHQELKRKHVTKSLLWQEYRESQPDGYEYSQFCAKYQLWAGHLGVTMRQVHVARVPGWHEPDQHRHWRPTTATRSRISSPLTTAAATSRFSSAMETAHSRPPSLTAQVLLFGARRKPPTPVVEAPVDPP